MKKVRYPRRKKRPTWLKYLEQILGVIVLGAVILITYNLVKKVLDPVILLYFIVFFKMWFKK